MQLSVIFGILINLLNRKTAKRDYLAEKYEISPRTVSRYIDILAESGVPIISFRGKEGGYAIADDYKIDKNYFTDSELTRLLNILKATKAGFGDKVNDNILDKITNIKLNQHNDKYFLRTDKLIIDAGTWNNPQKFRDKISVLNKAIEENRSVYMYYTDNKEIKSERKIDPYSLALKEGIWYAYCWCHSRNDFRLFKLSRIRSMSMLDEIFERRESDVYAKLNANINDDDIVDVEFEFSNMVRSEIEEWLGTDAIFERGTALVAKASLFGGNMLIAKLLSLGSSIKIISPYQLMEEMLVECQRILAVYGKI